VRPSVLEDLQKKKIYIEVSIRYRILNDEDLKNVGALGHF